MAQLTRVLCTICMRDGSKGVPRKNLRELHGKPLVAYTIEHARESALFEHIVVSTDSHEIAEVAKSFGAESWFLRPAELATDEAPKLLAIRHALQESEKHYGQIYDVIVDLDATSPLRKIEDIVGAYRQFLDEKADILISGCPSRKNPYFNMVEEVNGRIQKVKQLDSVPTRRQDAPEVYDMNASIYIWNRKALIENETLFTDKTSLFIMPEERSLDIDTDLDWSFVEFIMKKSEKIND
mgnify:CR=1 FL=1